MFWVNKSRASRRGRWLIGYHPKPKNRQPMNADAYVNSIKPCVADLSPIRSLRKDLDKIDRIEKLIASLLKEEF